MSTTRLLALCLCLLLESAGWSFAQRDVSFAPEVYAGRRARFLAQLDGAPFIIAGRNLVHDGEAKQEANFTYLTGVESPYAIFVAIPGEEKNREVLFLPEKYQFAGAQFPYDDDRFRDVSWNQPIRRLYPGDEAESRTGIGETYPLDEFAQRLPELVADAAIVFMAQESGTPYAPPGLAPHLTEHQQLERSISELLPRAQIRDASAKILTMQLVKDEHEIAALRRAAEISAMGLNEVLEKLRPGMNDLEIAGIMEAVWKREGSPRASFGPIVSSGAAAISLYTLKAEKYHSIDHVAQAGELVFIDYGAAEYRMYTSDICRTFPVSGTFTAEQRKYYEIVLEAQLAALAIVKPGVMMLDVVKAAAEVYRQHELTQYEDIDLMGADNVWGIMPSPTHYLERGEGLTPNYSGQGRGIRDLGHHIGLDTTESRDYSMPLVPGMVFTVEPKLYIPAQNMAIMIEDIILVTEDGYDNLSKDAVKGVREIERLMAASR